MRTILVLVLAAAMAASGCKAIEGGYESNRAKQEAQAEKMMKEGD
jgi:hypothetical protein